MPFAATWMDLETIILIEVSQTVKDKHHTISPICGIWKKKKRIQMNLVAEQKQTQDFEKLMVIKGDRWWGGRERLGVWIGICTLKYME